MTEFNDARIAAWIGAWVRVKSATELRVKAYFGESQEATAARRTEDSRQIDLLLREADLLSRLVNAPLDVGLTAGEWVVREERDRQDREDQELEDFRAVVFDRPSDDSVGHTGADTKPKET